MTRRKTAKNIQSVTAPIVGILAGFIELGGAEDYRVRLTTGELVAARLAPGVERALALDCLAKKRVVLLAAGLEIPLILGALQTGLTPQIDANGDLVLRARKVRLDAEEHLELRAGRSGAAQAGATGYSTAEQDSTGQSCLQLNKDGKIRIRGERMLMNVTASLRVYSTLVELP